MELYHVLNRGVDRRTIFDTDADHARFVHDLYEFNDTKPAPDGYRRKTWEFMKQKSDTRKRLVDIHGWCLMKNHYHLLVSERIEGGLTKFVRKINIGYSKYYNEIHRRSGTLFQGRTKKVLIETDAHFLHILHYVHLNPLDFHTRSHDWRTGQIQKYSSAISHLRKYRWSSFADYEGRKNFPSILTRNFFEEAYGGVAQKTLAFLKDLEWESFDISALE